MTKKEHCKLLLHGKTCYTCLYAGKEGKCGIPVVFKYGQELPKERTCREWQNKIIYWMNLNDPTVGMSVLSTPGITFSKAQKIILKNIERNDRKK